MKINSHVLNEIRFQLIFYYYRFTWFSILFWFNLSFTLKGKNKIVHNIYSKMVMFTFLSFTFSFEFNVYVLTIVFIE